MFKNKGFKIIKEKKIQIEKAEAENFIKCMKLSHFLMIYAHIYHQALLL
jgi:nucleoside-diphosphate kinase